MTLLFYSSICAVQQAWSANAFTVNSVAAYKLFICYECVESFDFNFSKRIFNKQYFLRHILPHNVSGPNVVQELCGGLDRRKARASKPIF